jgi:hypothetical protein
MLLVFKEAVSFVKTLELVLVFVVSMSPTPTLLDLLANLANLANIANIESPVSKTPIKEVFRK